MIKSENRKKELCITIGFFTAHIAIKAPNHDTILQTKKTASEQHEDRAESRKPK